MLLKISKVRLPLQKSLSKNIYAKAIENARINFSVSPYRTLLFSRKENLKFFEVALAFVLCNDVVGSIMNMWGYLHWNTANTILAFCKTTIKLLKQDVRFVQTYQVYCNNWLSSRSALWTNTAMLMYTHICSGLINSKIALWSRRTNFILKSIEIEKLFS